MELSFEPVLNERLFDDVSQEVISEEATTDTLKITQEQAEEILNLSLMKIWDKMYDESIPCAMPCNLNIEQFARKLVDRDDTIKAEFDEMDEEYYLALRNHRWRIRQDVMTGELYIHYGKSSDYGMLVKERGDEILIVLDDALPRLKEEIIKKVNCFN